MLTDKEYKELSIIIIKNIRDNRSQKAINIKLNYTYNQVSKWERGIKKVRWNDLINLCEVCDLDLKKNLLYRFQYPGDLDWRSFFRFLADQNFENKLMSTFHFSSRKIRNWYLKGGNPTLIDCLKVFEAHSPVLLSFCNIFSDLQDLPFLKKRVIQTKTEAQLIGDFPVSGFILCELEVDDYLNSPLSTVNYMVEKYKINPDIVKICLDIALKSNLIRVVGDEKHELHQVEVSPNTDLATIGQRKNTKNSLVKLASEVISKIPEEKQMSTNGMRNFSHMYFGANQESADEILKVTTEYFKKIREINMAAKPPFDRVGVVNIQLFDDIYMGDLGVSLEDL
jgi:transcriptional regulator with XRE-family HTH domain